MPPQIIVYQTPTAHGQHGRDRAGAFWWRFTRRPPVACAECGQVITEGWRESAYFGPMRCVCPAHIRFQATD